MELANRLKCKQVFSVRETRKMEKDVSSGVYEGVRKLSSKDQNYIRKSKQ